MSKKLKYLSSIILTVILVTGITISQANAALTLEALALTSNGVLTLNSSATSNILIGSNLTTGNVGIGTTSPLTKLDVNGAVKVGTATTCDTNTKGSIRYNATDNILEYCNGTSWLDTSGAPFGTISAFNGSCPTGWSELTEARGRTIIGAGQGSGLTDRTLASTGGEESHTLLQAELPNVNFTVSGTITPRAKIGPGTQVNIPSNNYMGGAGSDNIYSATHNNFMAPADFSLTAASGGSGTSLNVMQPYIALTWCKKMTTSGGDSIPSPVTLSNLSDVSIASPTNGNIFSYRSSSSKWEANTNFHISDSGNVGVGTNSPNAKLDINSNSFILRSSKTPSSASDTCVTGTMAWDSDYTYVCVTTNTWKRSALTTW